MNDTVGNAYLRMQRDRFGNVIRAEAFDKDGNKVTTIDGWQRFEADYDGAGNAGRSAISTHSAVRLCASGAQRTKSSANTRTTAF